MKLDTIGKNIRKYRNQRKLRQDQLPEKTDLSTNYIGMVERGEKIPALETFLKIANALEVSADMLLADVLYTSYAVKDSLLTNFRTPLRQPVILLGVMDMTTQHIAVRTVRVVVQQHWEMAHTYPATIVGNFLVVFHIIKHLCKFAVDAFRVVVATN